jgi:hypothetical protein
MIIVLLNIVIFLVTPAPIAQDQVHMQSCTIFLVVFKANDVGTLCHVPLSLVSRWVFKHYLALRIDAHDLCQSAPFELGLIKQSELFLIAPLPLSVFLLLCFNLAVEKSNPLLLTGLLHLLLEPCLLESITGLLVRLFSAPFLVL